MFNRSTKYFVLVVINIVVVTVLFMGKDQNSDVFDTDYVIDLLDNNKQLERQIEDLSAENKFLETSGDDIQRQIMQTRAMIDSNVENLEQCRNEQSSAIALTERQATERRKLLTSQSFNAEECSDNAVQVSFLTKQMASLKTQLQNANTKSRNLNTENQLLQVQLDKVNDGEEAVEEEQKVLQEIVQELEQDLLGDIYIKQIYTTPTYCQPPRFSELVCVQRLLVRPLFSKKPFTDVQTKLTNPKGKVIGKFSFDSSKAKLINFPFPENTEQPAGEYTVTFVVNDQTLVEKIVLKH
ncbi:MAG: hypothetical protein ACI97K_002683 [Glaciecola sp.]|jgi:hypothetical protein